MRATAAARARRTHWLSESSAHPDAGREFGIGIIPTQIFYDAKGKEVLRHEGFLDKATIVAELTKLGVR